MKPPQLPPTLNLPQPQPPLPSRSLTQKPSKPTLRMSSCTLMLTQQTRSKNHDHGVSGQCRVDSRRGGSRRPLLSFIRNPFNREPSLLCTYNLGSSRSHEPCCDMLRAATSELELLLRSLGTLLEPSRLHPVTS